MDTPPIPDRAAHTQGPWTVMPMRGSVHYGMFQVQPWADRQRAMLRGEKPDTGSADEAFANTRLIAAAPELLEVAKMLLAFTKGTIERAGLTDTNGIVAASEAVIAKAEGRP